MDFTADFIMDFSVVFIMDFNANVMLNPPDFIIDFMTTSLHLPGFHLNQQDFIMDFTLDSIPVADAQISCLKSGRFHEIQQIS